MSSNNIERFDLCAGDCSNDCMTVMQPAAEGAFVRYADLPVSLPDAISVVEGMLHEWQREREKATLMSGYRKRMSHYGDAAYYILTRLRALSPGVAPTTNEPENEACSHWREGDSDHCPLCGTDLGPTSKDDVASVIITSEPTVEDCLRELRELFPGEAVLIEFHDCTGIKGYQGNGYVKISGGTVHSAAPTLSDCMAQVRRFVKEGK